MEESHAASLRSARGTLRKQRVLLSTAALVVISAGTVACTAGAPRQPRAAEFEEKVAGCYELQAGTWETHPAVLRILDPAIVPRTFILSTERATGWTHLDSDTLPLFVARANPNHFFTVWSRTRPGSDSIFVRTPLPHFGAMLYLAPARDDLAGTIRVFTDMIPADGVAAGTAPITARRVDCEVTGAWQRGQSVLRLSHAADTRRRRVRHQ